MVKQQVKIFHCLSYEMESFNTLGYCVIEDVIPVNDIDEMFNTAMNNYAEIISRITEKALRFGIGIKNGFKEIVQRHPLRYEMPYLMNNSVFDKILENATIIETVKSILGDDAVVVNRSLVISLPGSDVRRYLI